MYKRQFLYPTGWTRVKVEGGPEIIYHDLINSNETLSLVVSNVNKEIDLEQLGSPTEVGQTLIDTFTYLNDNTGGRLGTILGCISGVILYYHMVQSCIFFNTDDC